MGFSSFFLFHFILLCVSCRRVGACFFQIHNNFRCHRNRTYQHYGIIEITSEIICSKSNEFQSSNSRVFSRIEFPVVVKTERQLRLEAARQQQQHSNIYKHKHISYRLCESRHNFRRQNQIAT